MFVRFYCCKRSKAISFSDLNMCMYAHPRNHSPKINWNSKCAKYMKSFSFTRNAICVTFMPVFCGLYVNICARFSNGWWISSVCVYITVLSVLNEPTRTHTYTFWSEFNESSWRRLTHQLYGNCIFRNNRFGRIETWSEINHFQAKERVVRVIYSIFG